MVVANGMMLTIVGLVLGLGGALGLTRLLGSLLFGVGARDPLTLHRIGGNLAAVALLACLCRPAARLEWIRSWR